MRRIARARRIMRNIFKKDPDFKRVYIANVAMCLYDNVGKIFLDQKVRNEVALKIVDLIFSKE